MQTVSEIGRARAVLDDARRGGATIGLVPTMGYLHDGHVSLMAAAADACDLTMATIFVNPLQFGPGEDLAAYPRDLDRDTRRCRDAGVGLLLVPSVTEMYPEPVLTTVSVAEITAPLEGASRPTHFSGVATVVAKLFNIAGACRAYFGEKDWQQLQVIRRMALDLSVPVDVVGCPIVREVDGLAMSSRNVYLVGEDRVAARALSRALQAGVSAIATGVVDAERVRATMVDVFAEEPGVQLEYAAVVDGATLRDQSVTDADTRLLVAARAGPARLIDNCAGPGPGPLGVMTAQEPPS